MVNIEARAGLAGRLSAEVIPGALPVTETPFLRNEVLSAAELPAALLLGSCILYLRQEPRRLG